MKKKVIVIFAGILVLFPCKARADLDVLSLVQDKIGTYMESVNKVVKEYSGIQAHLQELSMNRDILGQLKSKTVGALKARAGQLKTSLQNYAMTFINNKMDSFSLPGIKDNITMGAYVNPALRDDLATKLIKKTDMNNDVQAIMELDLRNNNLRIENVATLFANSLVNRRNLLKELSDVGKDDGISTNDDEGSQDQIPMLKDRYFDLSRKANHRWINVMNTISTEMEVVGESELTQSPVDDLTKVIGEDTNPTAEDLSGLGVGIAGNSQNSLTWNDIAGTVNRVKSGDYAGALNGVAGSFGNLGGTSGTINTMNNMATGIRTATNVYNSGKSGNWGAALASAGNGAGNLIGGDTGSIIGRATSSAGSAVNAGMRGDMGSVISSVGSGAGSVIGGNTGSIVNRATNSAGIAVNAGMRGDMGGVISSVGSSAGSVIGGNTGSIINRATDSAGSAVNAGVRGDMGRVISSVGSGAGSVIGGNTGSIVDRATNSAGSAVNAGKRGDMGGVISYVGNSAGSVVGGNTGGMINSAANSAGSAVNAGKRGDMSGVVSAAGRGTSSVLNSTGNNAAGSVVSSATSGAATVAGAQNADTVAQGINSGVQGVLRATQNNASNKK